MSDARYTGTKLPPKKRALVIAYLGKGEGIRATARLAKVSQAVVMAIRDAEYEHLSARKELMALECESVARLALDRMRADVERGKLSAPQLVPVFGVLVDKSLALRGDTPALPPQLHAHHHVHEFIQRNLRPVTEAQVLEALPDEEPRAHDEPTPAK